MWKEGCSYFSLPRHSNAIAKLMLVKQFFSAPPERSPGEMLRFRSLGFGFLAVGRCEIGCEGRTRFCDSFGQNGMESIQKASEFVKKKDISPINETFWAVLALHGVQILTRIHKCLGKRITQKRNYVISNRLLVAFLKKKKKVS